MIKFSFKGLHGCHSVCGVEVRKLSDTEFVVIATELDDNPGTSVTNAWPSLAYIICQELCLVPCQVRWAEHYPPRGHRGNIRETWEWVNLDWDKHHFFTMSQDRHPWEQMTIEEIESLHQ